MQTKQTLLLLILSVIFVVELRVYPRFINRTMGSESMSENPKFVAVWWYTACRSCTAKWFAPFQPVRCPRCGATMLESQQGSPPWLASQADASEADCLSQNPPVSESVRCLG